MHCSTHTKGGGGQTTQRERKIPIYTKAAATRAFGRNLKAFVMWRGRTARSRSYGSSRRVYMYDSPPPRALTLFFCTPPVFLPCYIFFFHPTSENNSLTHTHTHTHVRLFFFLAVLYVHVSIRCRWKFITETNASTRRPAARESYTESDRYVQ